MRLQLQFGSYAVSHLGAMCAHPRDLRRGIMLAYDDITEHGWAWWALSIPVYLLLWDLVFYVLHLALHIEPVGVDCSTVRVVPDEAGGGHFGCESPLARTPDVPGARDTLCRARHEPACNGDCRSTASRTPTTTRFARR